MLRIRGSSRPALSADSAWRELEAGANGRVSTSERMASLVDLFSGQKPWDCTPGGHSGDGASGGDFPRGYSGLQAPGCPRLRRLACSPPTGGRPYPLPPVVATRDRPAAACGPGHRPHTTDRTAAWCVPGRRLLFVPSRRAVAPSRERYGTRSATRTSPRQPRFHRRSWRYVSPRYREGDACGTLPTRVWGRNG